MLLFSHPNSWNKISVIRLGIDLTKYIPTTIPAKKDSLRFVTIGRLSPAKGQQILLEAFSIFRNRGHQAVLEIVGDGPLRQELLENTTTLGMDPFITFHGALNQSKTLQVLDGADMGNELAQKVVTNLELHFSLVPFGAGL